MSEMLRTSPSIDLHAFAEEHLLYELNMFWFCREALNRRLPNQESANVLLEGCALHLRNLIDFFYLDRPMQDDIVAEDYVPNWAHLRPPIAPSLDAAKKRANKETAHLTTKRYAGVPAPKHWDFRALSDDLRPAIVEFLKHFDSLRMPLTAAALKRI